MALYSGHWFFTSSSEGFNLVATVCSENLSVSGKVLVERMTLKSTMFYCKIIVHGVIELPITTGPCWGGVFIPFCNCLLVST